MQVGQRERLLPDPWHIGLLFIAFAVLWPLIPASKPQAQGSALRLYLRGTMAEKLVLGEGDFLEASCNASGFHFSSDPARPPLDLTLAFHRPSGTAERTSLYLLGSGIRPLSLVLNSPQRRNEETFIATESSSSAFAADDFSQRLYLSGTFICSVLAEAGQRR